MKIKTPLTVIASAICLHLSAFAETSAPAPSASPARNRDATPLAGKFIQAMDKLDLDQSQRAEMKDLLKKNLPTVKPLVRQMIDERRALQDAIRAVPINESAIRAQSAKVAALETELAVKRAYLSRDIQTILRPEQIAELKELKGKVREKIDNHRSRLGNFLGAE